jgi:hypothetical protein
MRPEQDLKAPPSRNPAAQRRAMQAALTAAVLALRSPAGRGGWQQQPPPGGYA